MGQSLSFHELQDCVCRDFSDRVLVSNGLFRSPYPRGTHFKCEVDLFAAETSTEWKEEDIELVVQVITGVQFTREYLKQTSKTDGVGNVVMSGNLLSSLKNHSTEVKSVEDYGQSLSPNEPISPAESFDSLVSKTISQLASHFSVEAVSFDAIVNTLHRLHSASSKDDVSVLLDCLSFTEDFDVGIEKPLRLTASLDSSAKKNNTFVRNANIVPLLGALQGGGVAYLVYPPAPFTLESILHFSPTVLDDDWTCRFLVYQLLSGIAFCHGRGIVHGDLKPSNILLTDAIWCWITGFHVGSIRNKRQKLPNPSLRYVTPNSFETGVVEDALADTDIVNWQSAFKRWWRCELSNYDYLLTLNRLAGRRWGDRGFHTVMPWVIDFSVRPDEKSDAGWRDLTKSKWHLAKGDEQLDFTYATAEIPHHVSDECLSELAVCIYKARRLPLFVLRRTVRSVYEPNEYPASLQRLYHWTPDECIPEFYSEASVFSSLHAGMNDLAVPPWAESKHEFIQLHRAALEGERVSKHLHHWIDLTFGYKLSGEAAIAAKNVTLSATNPALPRSQGRRQLFSIPHPQRQCSSLHSMNDWQALKQTDKCPVDSKLVKVPSFTDSKTIQSGGTNVQGLEPAADTSIFGLESLERAAFFCESARHLSPVYRSDFACSADSLNNASDMYDLPGQIPMWRSNLSGELKNSSLEFDQEMFAGGFESREVGRINEGNFQDFGLWQNRERDSNLLPEGASDDIFGIGCILAEIYLKRSLFDPVSIRDFQRHGLDPLLLQQLPVHVQALVKAMIEWNPGRKLSATILLESPFFPSTVRVVHFFLSLLHMLESPQSRLELVANLASRGAFLQMDPLAAEKCISACFSPLVMPCESISIQACMDFLNASILALKPHKTKLLLVPAIQNLLQGQGNSGLKIALLQTAFMRDVCRAIGINLYLQKLHFVVLSTLQQSFEDGPANAASCFLMETCQDFGLPITCNQTIMPLFQQFGRDITIFGINTLVGIGKKFGEFMVAKHMLPYLRAMIMSCLHSSPTEKSGPAESWRMLAMDDALIVLERLLNILSSTTVLVELVQEPHDVLTKLLLHPSVNNASLQRAGRTLVSICECIGPDPTSVYILPHLQQLFEDVAFDATTQDIDGTQRGEHKYISSFGSVESLDGSSHRSIKERVPESSPDNHIGGLAVGTNNHISKPQERTEPQMDLVLRLYSGLASLLGIEKLRQCLATWLILEQLLLKLYDWKWECDAEGHQRSMETVPRASKPSLISTAEFSPTSMFLNEIGWSVPQPFVNRSKLLNAEEDSKQVKSDSEAGPDNNHGLWIWVLGCMEAWESTDYLNRPGIGLGIGKDERPWKLKAITVHSWRAHPGSIKAVAVVDGESTVFTAGLGTRMRGLVKQWNLSTAECVMDYTGHDEAVCDICVLPWTGRAVSCDGTIHIWNMHEGEQIAVFSESVGTVASLLSSAQAENARVPNIGIVSAAETALSSGILSTRLNCSVYTCMHLLEPEERLIAGTGNGHVRFIDLSAGRYLHSWQCDSVEMCASSLVSAIASSGEQSHVNGRYYSSSSWIATAFSSGQCRLLDLRAGSVVARWKAHEGYITKLVAFDNHFLISSSLDKSLRLWDIRRTPPAQLQVFQGHSHGVSSFALWSNNLLSAGGNKLGLSTLSHSAAQGQEWQNVKCHRLYSAELSSLNLSSITTIIVLPFSRLLLVGTDDGFLRICH